VSRFDFARDMKAADLEQIIVETGFDCQHGVLTDEIKAAALQELSRRRGKRTDASPDTWERVETFLASRLDLREQP